MPEFAKTGGKGVLSWATDIDPECWLQAGKCARMPFVPSHVALMPDAHVGKGATVGSVIPTLGAIIPAAVGVDIGCGMIASETSLTIEDLPDNLDALMPLVEARIPAGIGGNGQHGGRNSRADRTALVDPRCPGYIGTPDTSLALKEWDKAISQYGTLGSGNHFVEVCLDERSRVWTVLHSGSRGIGNKLAQRHIKVAQQLCKDRYIHLEDPDLAYLVTSDPQFKSYIDDMLWCQRYAAGNREQMNLAITRSLFEVTGRGHVTDGINCHHNFTQREHHFGRDVWITRKGAIRAREGDRGVIPGSMGAASYIVSGLGNTASYQSCAHGAGRRMSRRQAKENITAYTLTSQMQGKTWNADRAEMLVDEAPGAYKQIEDVMEAQKDLVTIEHRLTQVFNFKG